jgi:hypothetical protein
MLFAQCNTAKQQQRMSDSAYRDKECSWQGLVLRSTMLCEWHSYAWLHSYGMLFVGQLQLSVQTYSRHQSRTPQPLTTDALGK